MQQDVEEYEGNEDPGFDLYEVKEKDFERIAKQLADKYGFPVRACKFTENRKKEFLFLKNICFNRKMEDDESDQFGREGNSSKNQLN